MTSTLGPSLSYTYDGDMVTTETSTGSFTLTRAASNGLLAGTTFSGGGHTIADSYQYDEFGGITRYKVTFDTTTTIYDVTYTRDPASGRIWTKSETIGPQSAPFSSCTAGYVYDPSTHFLKQQTGCPWAASWDYDANGNNTTYGTSFDAQDRMNVGSLGYDADGDTVSQSNGWSFLYDVPGNLRRVAAPWPSPTVLWDGDRIVGMEKVPWGVVGHYVYATKGNVPDLMYAPQGGASWSPFRIISDPLGSVKLVVRLDATYSPTAGGSTFYEWHDYSTWGIPVAGGGAQFGYVPFGFAGGLYDTNTGLYRYGARDYNPWAGRWWSKDPSRFGGGINLYAYANNDPVNLFDPTGNDVEVCSRVADLPVARDIGLPHKWLRTGSKEAGLGAVGGGVPGGNPDSPYFTQTSINDHTGEGDGAGASCQVVKDVDEDCVNKALAIGCPMGRWSGYNQCWTMVYDILDKCSTKPPPPRLPDWVYKALGFWGFLL